jgi:hypothetical protein
MEEIRSGVKRTTDSLRRTRALSGLRQPGGERSSEVGHHSWLVTDTSSPSTVSLSQIPSSNGTAPTASPSITRLSPCDPAELHSQLEAILLMHYFDHILPLQFPFYQPSIADGGRGWLLALLLQTRPLYDAALSLAAWHRNATMRRDPSKGKLDHGETREQGHEQAWGCEEHLYGRAIAGLRERIEILSQKGPEEGLKGSIEVLACIVQLILLEVSFLELFGAASC